MTMTDTEAKALALELLNTVRDSRGLPTATMEDVDGFAWFDAICRAIEREAATEARHAAEMRKQAERFSEALQQYYGINGCAPHPLLAPFILPAPDPLVEALEAAVKAYIAEHGIEAFKALPMFGSAKIGEAGE